VTIQPGNVQHLVVSRRRIVAAVRVVHQAALRVRHGALPRLGCSVFVALPTIGRALSMEAVTLGWVTAAYMLVAAMLTLPMGRWADLHGRKRAVSGLTSLAPRYTARH